MAAHPAALRLRRAPSPAIWLGTDDLGRDVLSRLIFGTRVALTVAFVAASARGRRSARVLGLLAGYFGGWVDAVVSRLVEIWMAFPPCCCRSCSSRCSGSGVALGDRRHRDHRLDALRPRGPRRHHGAGAGRLRDGGPHARLRPRSPSCSARSCPTSRRCLIALVALEMGIAVVVEAILSFVGPVGLVRHADLGRHDRVGAADHLPGLVGVRGAARRACSPPCWPSTSSATACAARSIR